MPREIRSEADLSKPIRDRREGARRAKAEKAAKIDSLDVSHADKITLKELFRLL
jgi:hypothetical protein